MSYIEVTGKTEEEAVRKALTQLGLERDDVSLEILERAKSGFLGIGGSPARIRRRSRDLRHRRAGGEEGRAHQKGGKEAGTQGRGEKAGSEART